MNEITTDQARERAAEAMRLLGHTLVERDGDIDLLLRVAEAAERVAGELQAAPVRVRDIISLKKAQVMADATDGEQISHFSTCFVSGAHNPMGIGMEVFREGDEVRAHVVLESAFEGAPGRSHGGIVAAIFDDVLGYLLSLTKSAAFTGELTVRYHAATPIKLPLEFRAREVSREGRKIFAEAEAHAEGRLIASAKAIFITVDPAQFKP